MSATKLTVEIFLFDRLVVANPLRVEACGKVSKEKAMRGNN
jgi:hypothetical protein